MIHVRAAQFFCVLLGILALVLVFAWGANSYPATTGLIAGAAVMIGISYLFAFIAESGL